MKHLNRVGHVLFLMAAPKVRNLSVTSETVFALNLWSPNLRLSIGRGVRTGRSVDRCLRQREGKRCYGDLAFARAATRLPLNLQLLALPQTCPGCGAHAQLRYPQEAGYYSSDRKAVRNYVSAHNQVEAIDNLHDAELFDRAAAVGDEEIRSHLGVTEAFESTPNMQRNR